MKPPARPRALAELRLRYTLAIDHLRHRGEPITEANIFDFHDGVRLVISREARACGEIVRVSAGCLAPSETYEAMMMGAMSPGEFGEIAREAFRAISHDDRRMNFLGYCGGAIAPQWSILHRSRKERGSS